MNWLIFLTTVMLTIGGRAYAAEIDLSPAVEYGLRIVNEFVTTVAIALVSAIFAYVGLWIKKKTGIEMAAIDNTKLHEGIQRGVDALEGRIRDAVYTPEIDHTKIRIDNPLVAIVANRMIEMSPDLLNRIGVNPDRLRELAAEKIQTKAAQIEAATLATDKG